MMCRSEPPSSTSALVDDRVGRPSRIGGSRIVGGHLRTFPGEILPGPGGSGGWDGQAQGIVAASELGQVVQSAGVGGRDRRCRQGCSPAARSWERRQEGPKESPAAAGWVVHAHSSRYHQLRRLDYSLTDAVPWRERVARQPAGATPAPCSVHRSGSDSSGSSAEAAAWSSQRALHRLTRSRARGRGVEVWPLARGAARSGRGGGYLPLMEQHSAAGAPGTSPRGLARSGAFGRDAAIVYRCVYRYCVYYHGVGTVLGTPVWWHGWGGRHAGRSGVAGREGCRRWAPVAVTHLATRAQWVRRSGCTAVLTSHQGSSARPSLSSAPATSPMAQPIAQNSSPVRWSTARFLAQCFSRWWSAGRRPRVGGTLTQMGTPAESFGQCGPMSPTG